jgi:hypothetical protein
MLAEHLLKQRVYGTHASTTPAESAGGGNEVYAMFAACPSTAVDSMIVDRKVANIAIQLIPNTCSFSRCCASMVAGHMLFQ